MKKYTYASIVPLIGGESIGSAEALNGQLPEYVLSYSAFKNNDEHYINYLKETKDWSGEYIHIDKDKTYQPKSVDVVNTVCPCAGLSSLSNSSNANSAVNEWMYKTAEYVLGQISPTVFWGENAPRLYSHSGKVVLDKLYEIGKKHGYSLTLYYTESNLHGNPQKRPRTFYIYTKGERALKMPWYLETPYDINEIFSKESNPNDKMNIRPGSERLHDSPWYHYNLYRSGCKNALELNDYLSDSTNLIAHSDGGYGYDLNAVADWMQENGYEKTANRARAMQKKRDDGKGYWCHGITIAKGNRIPTLIGAMPYYIINPYTEEYITLRDSLRIMGMPDDFNLSGENPKSKTNHICQNVPVITARDMMKGIIAYLDNPDENSIESTLLKQNNKKRTIENVNVSFDNNTQTLDEFLYLHKETNLL